MCTPDISHISSADYNYIYEPAEDSFLLIDALESELEFFKETRPSICLEVGSGSGICSTFLAREIGYQLLSICTDINPKAAAISKQTGEKNGVVIETIITDLVGSLSSRLANQVDVLIFNPPYVVTPSEEVGSSGIEASWAGGRDGREVIDRFLPQVAGLLSITGVFYMVIIKENKSEEIADILCKDGLKMTTVMSRRSGPEFLSVLKFHR